VSAVPPRPVTTSLSDTVRDLWLARADQHIHDSYAGISMSKFPEDLRVYEHLIWESGANVVIEIGTQFGGSALWFRDRLAAFARYRRAPRPFVISIDIAVEGARRGIEAIDPSYSDTIALLEADVADPGLAARVEALIPPGSRCLVSEDSAHVYDTTFASLETFARFVPPGGFFVVEDGCVDIDELRASSEWPRGVLPALHDWLATPAGSEFRVRRDLELYGISCHPEGFLERPAASVLGSPTAPRAFCSAGTGPPRTL
jgi:cephalosporin hydroxylase